MLSSLPLFVLVAVHLTPVTLAAPLPQDVSFNAPAGPPIRTAADLSAELGDLVIPQTQYSNDTATTAKVVKIRSPPADYAELVKAIGDLVMPSSTTANPTAEAATSALPTV